MAGLSIYGFPHGGRTIYGVICDDPKLPPFPNAAQLFQEAVALEGTAGNLKKKEGRLDDPREWPPELFASLKAVDKAAGSPWRLFWQAEVAQGRCSGLCALGIGSNKEKLKRASHLALAFTAVRSGAPAASSPELLELAAAAPEPALAPSSSAAAWLATCADPPPDPQPPLADSAGAPSGGLAADSPSTICPVDFAKRQLVAFRRRVQDLTPGQRQAVMCKSATDREVACAQHFCGNDAHVTADIRTILEGDDGFGRSWVSAWVRWGEPFTNPNSSLLGKKASKRDKNYKWYFGCMPPEGHPAPESGAVAPPPEPASSDAAPSRDLHALAQPDHPEEFHRERVVEGLQRPRPHGCLTISTLTSADTIPLGTDLDPRNNYTNLWVAGKISDPTARQLVQCNLACRVIDGENVGFSYGEEVLMKGSKHYDVEGVRRAVKYFQAQSLELVVVTKRASLQRELLCGDGVSIIKAEETDDVMLLNQAFERNCPVVSRDGFKKEREDLRISQEVRQWLSDSSRLQVRWTWDPKGNFSPDFPLPRPVVEPSHSQFGFGGDAQLHGRWDCHGCSVAVNKGTWYCDSCWMEWQRRHNRS